MLYLFLIILIALQIGDLMTTEYVINKQGGSETNPIMNKLFSKYGMHNVLVAKILFVSTVGILTLKLFPPALITLSGFYAAIVAWNCYQITKGTK
jgi:hypothetical protein